jgi:glyoxylase-like metal-dependent hydrolase (beta-lactamase superfamily II)
MVPQQPLGPFVFRPVHMSRNWKEVALWWPERRVLACGDVLGSARYYRAGDERVAVHPFLRLRPPCGTFAQLQPAAILCGHGPGVFDEADAALREAFRTARRRIPAQLASAVRAWRASRPS